MDNMNKYQSNHNQTNNATNATADYTDYAGEWMKFQDDLMADIFEQMEKNEAEEQPPAEALVSLTSGVDVLTSVEPKVINIQYIHADRLIYHE